MIIAASQWQRPGEDNNANIDKQVANILADIRRDGDQAIERYSQQFDGFTPRSIELKPFSDYHLSDTLRASLEAAAKRIERFAQFQMTSFTDRSFSDDYGEYGQHIVPIETIAAYIPGGRFPLVSTALMTLIPAKVAGCEQRIAVSPAADEALLAAASLAGATQFIQIGGVQAIAAMAYGSQFNTPVDMIVGPGNAYVNAAKGQVQRFVKIDTLAGPSELLVLADSTTEADWVYYDLLAQSEHDPLALSILCSWDKHYLEQIHSKLLADEIGTKMLTQGNLQLVLVNDNTAATAFANQMAPEHLSVFSPDIDCKSLTNYGALFQGSYSAVAYGDYCSGPNHTLPTLAKARQKGGLFVGDFVKVLSYQKINATGNRQLAEIGMPLAEAEGLKLHHRSMSTRIDPT